MTRGLRPILRLFLVLALGFSLSGPLRADEPEDEAGSPPAAAPRLGEGQLDQLLAPIALYPDALIALIFPAATTPTEVVLAARFLNAGGDSTQIDAQPWSESVKALARYPEIVKWMDENLSWTQQVGEAFLVQPADLMNSMQRLRARARASGALVDTPQQRVIVDGDMIEIEPAQPEIIYIPRYDPEVVYVSHSPGYFYPYGPYLTFGLGFPIGRWLCNDFDWHRRTIWVGDRRHDWREHRDWRRPPTSGRPFVEHRDSDWRAWRPPANRPRVASNQFHRPSPDVARPRPFPGTPNWPRTARNEQDGPDYRPEYGNRPVNAQPGDNSRTPTDDRDRGSRVGNHSPRVRPSGSDGRPDFGNRPSNPEPASVPSQYVNRNRSSRADNGSTATRPDGNNYRQPHPERPAGPAFSEPPRSRPERPAADQPATPRFSQPRPDNPPYRSPSVQSTPYRPPPPVNPPAAERSARSAPPSRDRAPDRQEQEK